MQNPTQNIKISPLNEINNTKQTQLLSCLLDLCLKQELEMILNEILKKVQIKAKINKIIFVSAKLIKAIIFLNNSKIINKTQINKSIKFPKNLQNKMTLQHKSSQKIKRIHLKIFSAKQKINLKQSTISVRYLEEK